MDVVSVGALCFGLAVGYITYRTLVRREGGAQISDLAAVIAVIGGGTVTGLFDPQQGDAFGWYSIGLLVGMAVYFAASLKLRGKENWAGVMGTAVLPGHGRPDRRDEDEQIDQVEPR
jgi:hypothetical protein